MDSNGQHANHMDMDIPLPEELELQSNSHLFDPPNSIPNNCRQISLILRKRRRDQGYGCCRGGLPPPLSLPAEEEEKSAEVRVSVDEDWPRHSPPP
ncbi:hypothetical protein Fmac_002071 [Flemingia macrophylla]|uniref:Uncharacterized protein n=1 Tax=Flemingia macrophylla TaxID=520843 RepID=A0ABD1NIX0_9FABA